MQTKSGSSLCSVNITSLSTIQSSISGLPNSYSELSHVMKIHKLASKRKGGTVTDSDFHNAALIGAEVESVYGAGGLSYIEACIEVAEYHGMDIEVLAKLLPKQIKDKLKAEASELRLLKEKYRITTLPV